jgi:hypothetical protein
MMMNLDKHDIVFVILVYEIIHYTNPELISRLKTLCVDNTYCMVKMYTFSEGSIRNSPSQSQIALVNKPN